MSVNHEDEQTSLKVFESLSSITRVYERAKLGEEDAATELWETYSKRLLGLARAVLHSRGIVPADVSEDSVVNAAVAKFFDALSRGRYQDVADRHDLWRLLAVITRNHALNQAKKYGNRIDRNLGSDSIFVQEASGEPMPEEVAALSDMIGRVEHTIRSRSKSHHQAERIIRVMTMTLSGHTQGEIASAIGQSAVTVRRNLSMIREIIEREE